MDVDVPQNNDEEEEEEDKAKTEFADKLTKVTERIDDQGNVIKREETEVDSPV